MSKPHTYADVETGRGRVGFDSLRSLNLDPPAEAPLLVEPDERRAERGS